MTNLKIERIGLDGGYDIGAVHRGLELLEIEGYCALREYHNNAMKKGFSYNPEKDAFICMASKEIPFRKLVYKKKNANYFRQYSIERKKCKNCVNLSHCIRDQGRCVINASSFYPSFFRNMERTETEAYKSIMRLRSIWSEGSFSALKREHNLSRAHKRGIERIKEECLFSALALNLKRMVKAVAKHVFRLRIIGFRWLFAQIYLFYVGRTEVNFISI